MWKYDVDDFDPPAPVVDAELAFGDASPQPVRMQIDSGADLSCIPDRVVPASGRLRYGQSLVAGYDGEIVVRKTYFVTIRIDERRFEDVETLPIAGDVGLLGRDVLNFLAVTLDGPRRRLLIKRES
jgi:predicted aspartyl protease